VIAERDPGTVSKLLQRLFTAIDDTAAFTWGAFEAVGEIIRHKPELLAGFIPQLYKYLAEEARRVQALEALGRISRSRPDLIRKIGSRFITLLADRDPRVRGNAAFLVGALGVSEGREALKKLRADNNEITVYDQGELERKTVGELASEALGNV
jgi:HEAT repeat protein